jgi:SAM-dependent methyltransferase
MSADYFDLEPTGYERGFARWTRRLADPFLDFISLAEGARILEAGAGTGSLTRALLARLGPGAVHACDLSYRYIEVFRRQIEDPRLHLLVADARKLPYGDGVFDASLSLLMLNFAGLPAMDEMVRATRPGGCFAAGVLDLAGGAAMMRRLFDLAADLAPAAAELRRDILGAELGRSVRAAAACRAAGLRDVTLARFSLPMDYESFADCWQSLAAPQGPTGLIVASLSAEEQAALKESLRAVYLAGEADGPRTETIDAWAVKGYRAEA